MFYIRKSKGNKKKLEEFETFKDGFDALNKYEYPMSLMYSINGKGIKIISTKDNEDFYTISMQKNKKDELDVLFKVSSLEEIYLKLKDISIGPDFVGSIRLSDSKSEFLNINSYDIYFEIISSISNPLDKALSALGDEDNVIPLDDCNSKKGNDSNIHPDPIVNLSEEIVVQKCEVDNLDSKANNEDLYYKDINYNNYDRLREQVAQNPYELEELSFLRKNFDLCDIDNDLVLDKKCIEYRIVGVGRAGSSIFLTRGISSFKEARELYKVYKEAELCKYKEIRLVGYYEDGTSFIRYKKSSKNNNLEYSFISDFVKDLSDRISFIKVLRNDILNAIAVEDKKCNLGSHILEASDFDLCDEVFVENIKEMKLATERRRDLKNSLYLLNFLSSNINVSPYLSDKVSSKIDNIISRNSAGSDKYKNEYISSFIDEYDESEASNKLKSFQDDNLTVRSCVSEGKVIVYKKSV